jgi:hypothetical protein
MSIVPKETIEVIGQSVGIATIPADVSAALAPDAEYRLREIMQVRRPALCPCGYTEFGFECDVGWPALKFRDKK